MSKLIVRSVFACSLVLGFIPALIQAQKTKTPPQDPSTYMHVHAPFAQNLVDKVKAHHDEIIKLGLHAVPPGETDNVIIANITRSKNGKKSSAADLEKLATGKPTAVRVDKNGIFDLLIPLTDAHGGDLGGGFVVMEVPFTKASNEKEALKIGVAIRDEIQAQIPSRAALYQP